MARKPRIHHPGGLYHVILRGNGGEDSRVLGDDNFMKKCLSDSKSLALQLTVYDIACRVCLEYDVDESMLRTKTQQRIVSEARAVVGWLAREMDCATLTEVGKFVNRDVGSISSAVRRLSERLQNTPLPVDPDFLVGWSPR